VPDVEGEHEQLRTTGVRILQQPKDLPGGQRHFICRAPGGLMVDVILVVLSSLEFAERYLP
jgi:hypothetical protein